MNDATGFGSRFLAEYRRLKGMLGVFDYNTIKALEKADRDGVVSVLDACFPHLCEAFKELARVGEPDVLARCLVGEKRHEPREEGDWGE